MTQNLKRDLNLFDAVMLGLGSIVGTGVFVSIGIAAGITGPSVVLAIAVAGMVATFNALSAAQLAAAYPKSGGTYEYGYQTLTPSLGFLAGWMFLLAKSASAATAALGFSAYLSYSLGFNSDLNRIIGFLTVLIMTAIVLGGIRRSSGVNTIIVSITLVSLLLFSGVGLFHILSGNGFGGAFDRSLFFAGDSLASGGAAFFHATALMFVAFTGYGRIATMAEEVRDPQKTIPKAIITTLCCSAFLYILISFIAVGSIGSDMLGTVTTESAAPLQFIVDSWNIKPLSWLIALGAMTAMLGVLLNLILGLSRIWLAMGRRGDMPKLLAKVNEKTHSPALAVGVAGGVIAALTLIGSIKLAWTFSAFTVLIYYSITNASALALKKEHRLFPRWVSVAGLISCFFLAWWIEWQVWVCGILVGCAGMVWHLLRRKP